MALKILAIAIFAIAASACSTTIKRNYGMISKIPITKDEFVISKESATPFEISDCVLKISIITLKSRTDFDKELANRCGEKWTIYDYSDNISAFLIPLFYGRACRTLSGSCEK